MTFYTAESVTDRITLIRSACGELLYLVEGNDRAALIDTCEGVGHLRAFVSSLTDKPLLVLLTHGHVDHAPGAPEFDNVWLNPRDLPLYRRHCRMEERTGYLQACLGPRFSELQEEDFVPPQPDFPFHPLDDGMSFDLGGIHIDAFSLYGHTRGCMVFLLREPRILILGDACNNSTFLFDTEATSLEEYRDNLRTARERLAGRFDRVFLSHHDMETGTDIMDNVLTLCDQILAGDAMDDIPYDFMGHHAFLAKRCNERFQRSDGLCGNLIYSKQKLCHSGS